MEILSILQKEYKQQENVKILLDVVYNSLLVGIIPNEFDSLLDETDTISQLIQQVLSNIFNKICFIEEIIVKPSKYSPPKENTNHNTITSKEKLKENLQSLIQARKYCLGRMKDLLNKVTFQEETRSEKTEKEENSQAAYCGFFPSKRSAPPSEDSQRDGKKICPSNTME